jgi:hypothetical protein
VGRTLERWKGEKMRRRDEKRWEKWEGEGEGEGGRRGREEDLIKV